ncbi:MAG: hypothetical protein II864_01475 [Prevotella sp.]|nr:hypothetical protein [Prevotella sp.]
MKKILTIITLMLSLTATAQERSVRPLRVYLVGGIVDKMALSSGSSLYHSRLDLNDVEHDDYVSLVVSDGEGERRYMLSQVDSLVMPNGRRVVFRGYTNGNEHEDENMLPPFGGGAGRGVKHTSFNGQFPGQGTGNVTFYWTELDRIRLENGAVSRATSLTAERTEAEFVFDDADFEATEYTVYYPDRTVTIAAHQSQTGIDNTDHIGPSGDCGTATAKLNDNVNDNYSFTLKHQAAYLCFLPRIDHLPSVRLTQIDVSCSSAIAGTYEQSTGGLFNGTNTSNKITLMLNRAPQQDNDFFLGHVTDDAQRMCGSYMVIAPQGSAQTFTVTYHLTDTLSRLSTTYVQTLSSFKPVANTVYPVTCHIPESLFRTIDMGYDYLWSSVNFGSDLPNEAGDFFTWQATHDAMTGGWEMPTEDTMDELLDMCTWTWGTYNGTEGWFVEGTNNGNDDIPLPRIFLPLNGYKDGSVGQHPENGYYWLDSGGETEAQTALVLTHESQAKKIIAATLAMNTRPVKAVSHDFRIPSSGTQTVDLRTHGPGYSIKVYDHAGPDDDYANGISGYLHIICAEGYKLNVSGSVNTESVGCDPFIVYDHTDSGNTEVARYGGSTTANATSKTNDVMLYFHSDGSSVRSGLNLTVTIQRQLTNYNVEIAKVEGGTLTASTYEANPEDTVTLTVTPAPGYMLEHIRVATDDKVLTLYDDDPKLFQSASSASRHYLMCDSVRVRDGNWYHDVSHFLMPYGDVVVTPYFVKADSTLEVIMAGNDTTFIERKYLQRLLDCGMSKFRFYDYAGKNGNYGNNVNGYMFVDAPVGYRMKIDCTTSLEGADHLYIYDGDNSSFHCLADPHGTVTTTTNNNVFFTHFKTDGSVVYSGYDCVVTLLHDDVVAYNIPSNYVLNLTEEQLSYKLANGVTSMKVYDNNGDASGYGNSMDGSLRFTLPEGYRLRVHGTIDTESGHDYLRVYDNEVEKVVRVGRNQTVDYTTESRVMRLRFHTDGSVVYDGLDLTVEFIAPDSSEESEP